jgi:lysozyme
MSTVISLACDLAKPFEGLSLVPYYCPAHYPTIGWGHLLSRDKTAPLSNFKSITLQEAELLLQGDVQEAFDGVIRLTKGITLTDNQLAALVDFTFNLGVGAFKGSTLLKLLKSNNFKGASEEFKRWVHEGKNVLPGLVKRRELERVLFNTP